MNVLLIFNQLPFKEKNKDAKTITFIDNQLKLNIMSLKYSSTTADYMQWDEMTNLVRRLSKDGDYKMSLLIAVGCFWGLRISDILSLHWETILYMENLPYWKRKQERRERSVLILNLRDILQNVTNK